MDPKQPGKPSRFGAFVRQLSDRLFSSAGNGSASNPPAAEKITDYSAPMLNMMEQWVEVKGEAGKAALKDQLQAKCKEAHASNNQNILKALKAGFLARIEAYSGNSNPAEQQRYIEILRHALIWLDNPEATVTEQEIQQYILLKEYPLRIDAQMRDALSEDEAQQKEAKNILRKIGAEIKKLSLRERQAIEKIALKNKNALIEETSALPKPTKPKKPVGSNSIAEQEVQDAAKRKAEQRLNTIEEIWVTLDNAFSPPDKNELDEKHTDAADQLIATGITAGGAETPTSPPEPLSPTQAMPESSNSGSVSPQPLSSGSSDTSAIPPASVAAAAVVAGAAIAAVVVTKKTAAPNVSPKEAFAAWKEQKPKKGSAPEKVEARLQWLEQGLAIGSSFKKDSEEKTYWRKKRDELDKLIIEEYAGKNGVKNRAQGLPKNFPLLAERIDLLVDASELEEDTAAAKAIMATPQEKGVAWLAAIPQSAIDKIKPKSFFAGFFSAAPTPEDRNNALSIIKRWINAGKRLLNREIITQEFFQENTQEAFAVLNLHSKKAQEPNQQEDWELVEALDAGMESPVSAVSAAIPPPVTPERVFQDWKQNLDAAYNGFAEEKQLKKAQWNALKALLEEGLDAHADKQAQYNQKTDEVLGRVFKITTPCENGFLEKDYSEDKAALDEKLRTSNRQLREAEQVAYQNWLSEEPKRSSQANLAAYEAAVAMWILQGKRELPERIAKIVEVEKDIEKEIAEAKAEKKKQQAAALVPPKPAVDSIQPTPSAAPSKGTLKRKSDEQLHREDGTPPSGKNPAANNGRARASSQGSSAGWNSNDLSTPRTARSISVNSLTNPEPPITSAAASLPDAGAGAASPMFGFGAGVPLDSRPALTFNSGTAPHSRASSFSEEPQQDEHRSVRADSTISQVSNVAEKEAADIAIGDNSAALDLQSAAGTGVRDLKTIERLEKLDAFLEKTYTRRDDHSLMYPHAKWADLYRELQQLNAGFKADKFKLLGGREIAGVADANQAMGSLLNLMREERSEREMNEVLFSYANLQDLGAGPRAERAQKLNELCCALRKLRYEIDRNNALAEYANTPLPAPEEPSTLNQVIQDCLGLSYEQLGLTELSLGAQERAGKIVLPEDESNRIAEQMRDSVSAHFLDSAFLRQVTALAVHKTRKILPGEQKDIPKIAGEFMESVISFRAQLEMGRDNDTGDSTIITKTCLENFARKLQDFRRLLSWMKQQEYGDKTAVEDLLARVNALLDMPRIALINDTVKVEPTSEDLPAQSKIVAPLISDVEAVFKQKIEQDDGYKPCVRVENKEDLNEAAERNCRYHVEEVAVNMAGEGQPPNKQRAKRMEYRYREPDNLDAKIPRKDFNVLVTNDGKVKTYQTGTNNDPSHVEAQVALAVKRGRGLVQYPLQLEVAGGKKEAEEMIKKAYLYCLRKGYPIDNEKMPVKITEIKYRDHLGKEIIAKPSGFFSSDGGFKETMAHGRVHAQILFEKERKAEAETKAHKGNRP